MDSTRLGQARDYAIAAGGGSGFITRGGRVVMSWGTTTGRYDMYSTTKSMGVTMLGLAVGDGLVDVSNSALGLYSGFGVPPTTNAATGWLDDITLQQLATHTAGFAKPGGFIDLIYAPGSTWSYSDGGANWLADVLTVRFAQDLRTVFFSRVLDPLGVTATDLTWRDNMYRGTTIEGIPRREFGSGISANMNAMARIGYLYLRGGRWDSGQIIPQSFVTAAGTQVPGIAGLPVANPASFPNASRHYGLLWWNNADGTLPGVPTDAFWSWGLGESFIIVIPSLDIVVARAGGAWQSGFSGIYSVIDPFLTPIAQSVVAPAPNHPPIVNAGANQTIVLPQTTAALGGVVSDDDLPSGTLATLWSTVSGPGAVSFADPQGVTTTATFPAEGTYVLRLTANDGALSGSDDVQVTVTADTGLAGHWRFDEGAGTLALDSSGGGNTGTLTNGPVWTSGKLDQAVAFDGVNDYVRVNDPGAGSALDLTASFSQAAWVRFDALPSSGSARNPRILQKSSSTSASGSYNLSVRTSDAPGLLALSLRFGGTTYTLRGSQTLATGRWYHVAAVKEGPSVRLYVDGVQDGPTLAVPAGAPDPNNDPLYFGESPGNSDGALDGALDDLRLYDRALSASEVAQLAAPAADTTPPSTPVIQSATPVSPTQVDLVWTGASDPESGVASYRVDRDGTPVGSVATTSFSDTGLLPNTSYTYVITAVNGAGLSGSPSLPVSATTPVFVNHAPTISAPANAGGVENSPVSVTGTATDPDGQNVTLSQSNNAPFFPASSSAGPSPGPSISLTGTPDWSQSGGYTITWSANDGAGGTATTTTALAVSNTNRNPALSAPATATGLILQPVSVTGSASDPDAETVTLSQTSDAPFFTPSGTAGPSLSASITLTGTPTSTQSGSFSVNWSATDGNVPAGTAAATTTLTISTGNQAPAVSAGVDQTITLPTNTVALQGTVGDDGLPNGTVTSLWSLVSGPGAVTFGDASAAATSAQFATPGTYILRLTADDGALAASDDVQITVRPASSLFASYLAFDGVNDYARFNDPGVGSAIDLPANFTMGAWVRFAQLPSTGAARNPRILQKSGDTSAAGSYYLSARTSGAPGVLSLRLKFAGTTYTLDGAQTLATNRWYYVAAVKEGSSVRLYVDGVQDGPTFTVPAGAPDSNNDPLYLGESPANSDGALGGALNDVRLYNRALSASEIASTKDAELSGSETGLVLYLPLNEGSGQTLTSLAPGAMAGWLGASASVESADPLWASDGSGAATASLAPEGPALASPDRSFAGGLRLEPPRPNPLSLSTTLVIRSDRSTVGRMEVFDVTGRLVKTLLAGAPIPAGGLSIVWDGSTDRGESAAAGVYVIRLRATGASLQQRVIRLK